jgi:hypothetical protein
MKRTISTSDDILDSRDIQERINELEDELEGKMHRKPMKKSTNMVISGTN